MDWKPDMFIYHAPCDDGFASAWAVWKRWGDSVEFVPTNYGHRSPEVLGKHVLIGDFSYKGEALETVLRGAASTVILDHHITAQNDLEQFRIALRDGLTLSVQMVPGMLRDLSAMGSPPCIAFFDMEQSGAALTWRFCFPHTPMPWLIRLVEDRDLWRFNLDQTEAFSSLLRSHDYDFGTWNDIHEALEDQEGHDILMLEARGILRFYQQQVKKQAASAYWTSIAGHDVPTVNCFNQLFASDVGHALLDAFPEAPFVATWSAVDGAMGFSLRSQDHRHDVSQIARRFGGGGHRNAAGFTLPRP